MTYDDCWLPPLLPYDPDRKWDDYEALLYLIFRSDFIESQPFFEGKIVKVRYHPKVMDYEESFIHLTCNHYDNSNERQPDLRRCERIEWIRAFIENYQCKNNCKNNCEGIKIWEEPYKMYTRVHLFFEEEKFLVVLERRETYFLLITGYYLDYSHSLRKARNQYERYKAKGAS